MGQSPFAKRPVLRDSGAGRRRSTRVEYVTPVVLTGRDASGQSFREETETSTVNLHGAKVLTHYQVMLGMQVIIQSPRTGTSEKAICVWVGEPAAGQTTHQIAVQLLDPKNLWGMEDPPADWEALAAMRAPSPPSPPERPAKAAFAPARAVSPFPGADSSPATVAPSPSAGQLGDFEKRATQVMETVLQVLHKQGEEMVRDTLQKFERRLDELVAAAEIRISGRGEKTGEEVRSSLQTLRADLAAQLTTEAEQVAESAEQRLRAKVAELFSALVSPAPGKATEQKK